MHILFKKITYKNILSVGDSPITINFLESKTTLISAPNGAGKSTSIDAIVFALYGKTFRKINKSQLVNSINKKDLLVEIFFDVGKDSYSVRRGIKPNVFEIHKNGEMLNKDAASKDYQEYLETDILKMTFKSFTQIVILGSATYIPFMDLPASQRREIIEDLLDIQVFSVMNVILKGKISENKEQLVQAEHEISLLEVKIDSAEKHNEEIRKIKQTEVDKIKKKAVEVLASIEIEEKTVEAIDKDISILLETISDKQAAKKTIDKIRTLIQELETKKKSHLAEINFYSDHDNCPTCKQGIDGEFKAHTVGERGNKIDEIQNGLAQLTHKKEHIETRLAEISDVEDTIQNKQRKANEQRVSIKFMRDQLGHMKKDILAVEKDVEVVDNKELLGYKERLETMQHTHQELRNRRELLGTVSSMLKDGGIKTSIIRTYIPIMNKFINQYLSRFDMFVDFNLDENFNETIKSRFRDTFSFNSFSEGEKMRISLSIMFAWRSLAKMRNSVSTNLLFLDETLDGSMETHGVEALIDSLKSMNANDNVFVISHRGEQFAEKFDRHLQFEKRKNFTQIIE